MFDEDARIGRGGHSTFLHFVNLILELGLYNSLQPIRPHFDTVTAMNNPYQFDPYQFEHHARDFVVHLSSGPEDVGRMVPLKEAPSFYDLAHAFYDHGWEDRRADIDALLARLGQLRVAALTLIEIVKSDYDVYLEGAIEAVEEAARVPSTGPIHGSSSEPIEKGTALACPRA